MSVRPVVFNADGSVDAVYDEQGHTGTIPAAEVHWSKNIDGTDNHAFIVLACPDGCGAASTHPVGGGAAPVEVQQMFIKKVELDGCACGSVEAGRTDDVPEAHVHLQVSRMDGPERWQASDAPSADPQAAPGTVKIVYANDTRLIVGEKPNGGVGNDHKLAHISEAEYAKLLTIAPAYLAADGDTVVSTPPMTWSDEELEARIAQLETQQSMQTNALRAALEARWSGEDSLDAWVKALDPNLETAPQTPLYAES